MARLAKCRVGHDDDDPARRAKRPVKGFEHGLERVHVLDAEHERGGVIAALAKILDRGESPRVANHETARAPMAAPGSLDEPRTRIDTRVARTGPDHCRRQHALPCPDVENLLAIAWILSAVGTLVLLFIVDKVIGLRVSPEDESTGLDLSQHGEEGYDLNS